MAVIKAQYSWKNRSQATGAALPVSVWHLLLGWVISIPLLFFALTGRSCPKGAHSIRATATADGGGSFAHRVGLFVVASICAVLILSRLPAVSSIGQRTKTIVAFPSWRCCQASGLYSRDKAL